MVEYRSRRELLLWAAGTAGTAALPRFALPPSVLAQTSPSPDRLRWWRNAGFGLFLHWGPYSVAGVEASWPIMVPKMTAKIPQPAISEADYVGLARQFDPRDFRPREWVRLARQAGMGYIVLTAKHHDGYCMFDAPGTDYSSMHSPAGRDLCSELAEACAAEDMPLGFYYSPPDMHDPNYRDTSRPVVENWTGEPDRAEWAQYLDTMEAHLRKLLTDYGDVAVVWFDALFDHARYDPERFSRLIHELSPSTLINDRLGAGDYVTPEQVVPKGVLVRPSVPVPDLSQEVFVQVIGLLSSDLPAEQIAALLEAGMASRYPSSLAPSPDQVQPWETCMTMNSAWGYVPTDTTWKSPETLVKTLVDVRAGGGNFLLNVGPMGNGAFPAEAVDRLTAVSRWMDRHGESIQRVGWGPLQGHASLRSTRRIDQAAGTDPKSQASFLFIPGWPSEAVDLGALQFSAATMVATGESVAMSYDGGRTKLRLPGAAPDPWVNVVRLSG